MTNFEKIKEKDTLDLATFLFSHQFGHCQDCELKGKQCSGNYFDDKSCIFGIKAWLEKEVEK